MRRTFNVRNMFYFIALSIASGIILASVKHSKKLTSEQKASLKEIKRLEKDAKKLCDEIKKHKNDKKWMDEHNDELQKRYDELYNAYQKAHENGSIRIINMVSKAYETKESANIIDTKLAIYESCDAGYITEDEKFELLTILEASATQKKNKGIEFITLPQKANELHDKLISEFEDNDDIYSIYTKSAIETRHKNYDVVDTSKDSYVLIVYSDNRVKNIIMKFLRDNRITKYSEITGYNEKNIWTKWKDKYNLKFGED